MDGDHPAAGTWRIVVLCGGDSAERNISLESGANVAAALAGRGHQVELLDPAKTELLALDWSRFDVAFIALHGTFGEDGGVQDLLDGIGLPYTGSGAQASRIAFHKADAKERFLLAEVPTPDYALIRHGAAIGMTKRTADRLGYPLVVKPNSQGSSYGVSLVKNPEQLELALALAFSFDEEVLLETALLGEEWTVPLLDQQILPPIRISLRKELFDYQAKYLDDTTGYAFAAATPQATVRAIEDAARRACLSLGTAGLARVDLRLDAQGRPYVLEVNTIPGMTSHSLVPKSAARLGWNLGDLAERMIARALRNAGGAENRQVEISPRASRRFSRVG